MATIGRQTTHATLWSAIEISTRYGVQLIVSIILARLLTPTDFGLIAMLLVFISVGALLADGGFGTALIQRQSVHDDDETTVFYFSMCLALLATGALWLGAGGIARFYHTSTLEPLTRVICFVLPMGAFGAVPDAVLTKQLRFKARAGAQFFASLASATLAITLAWKGFGVWSLVYQALADSALRSVMLWVFSGWCPRGRFRISSFRSLFGFGSFMLLSGLLSTVSVRIQSLLIGRLFDAGQLGYYTLAQNSQQAPTSFIGSLLTRVGLPVFSRMASDPKKLRIALRASLRVAMFLFLPCMAGIAVTAGPLIELVYGTRWAPAAPMLTLLALAAALWPMHVLNLTALSAQGRSDRFFRLEIIKNLIIVSATFIACPFGPTAVAGSMLVAGVCAVVVNTWYSKRMLDYGLLAQMVDQRNTLLLGIMAAVPAWAALHWMPRGIVALIIAVLIAATVYFSLAVALQNPALREIREIVSGYLTKRPQPNIL